jgi:hypothetical protein
MNSTKAEYNEKGYVLLRNFFPDEVLARYEKTVVSLHYQQCLKLLEFRNFLNSGGGGTG